MERARVGRGEAAAQERRPLRRIAALALGLALACRPEPASTDEPETKGDTAATGAVRPPPSKCLEPPSRVEAQAAFQEGEAQMQAARAVDEHMTAEVFDEVVAKLRVASEGGHVGGQSLFGRTVFGALITQDAPQPADRALWIEAITYLRTAALAGDPDALAFAPGLASAVPPARTEMPFSEIPGDWLIEAWRKADEFVACHGMPWRTPPSS